MKILFDIGHPAHVHLFRNAINILKSKGHDLKITARDKDIALDLLNNYGFSYEVIGTNKKGMVKKALNMLVMDLKLLKIVRQFNPDLIVSAGSPYAAQVSWITKKPSVAFVDTEHANLTASITYPFTDIICTPMCYKKQHGNKHVRYNGYHELAYLHPKQFTPNKDVLDKLNLSKCEKIIVVRFVSWNASHDIKDKGFENILDIVKRLEQYGRVIITSEGVLPEELMSYQLNMPSKNILYLMNYAWLYIGESATMASECAMLGTPSIFVSSSTRSYTDELEEKYGLVYNFSNPIFSQTQALDKAVEILNDDDIKREWARRHDAMLSEKIDVTAFMVDLIENYSKSFLEVLKKYDCIYSST